MKRRIYLGIMLVMMSVFAYATPRTLEQAATLAADFKNEQPQKAGAHKVARKAANMRLVHQVAKPNSSEAALYVFNDPNGGWVIISADDVAYDVLAYSNEGKYDVENENAAYFLDYYAEQIANAKPISGKERARRIKAEEEYNYATIAPLLGETQWDQRSPYNWLCPIDQADSTRSMTGCVATAAAQIMYHFKYPATGMGARAYDWKSVGGGWGHEYVDFTTGNYDWDNMLPQYNKGQYTQEQGNAVAKLMYHAGVATKMTYGGEVTGGSGSGGTSMATGLHEHFGYTLGKNHKGLDTVSYIKAVQAFENELKNNRIIMMGGNSHEFICDGADGTGKFHINFGWSGAGDGFYNLQAIIIPKDVPGAVSGNYTKGMSCIFGIEPEKEEDRIHVTGIAFNKTELNMTVGEQQYLDTIIYPETATNKGVHFYSSDESIATVNYKGKVSALKAGHATITAITCDGSYTASCDVTITNGVGTTVTELPISKNKRLYWGEDGKENNWKIVLYDSGDYPWLQFYIPGTLSNKKIAGMYTIGNGTSLYAWPSKEQQDKLKWYAKSGWLNITCVGYHNGASHQSSTYKIESQFKGPDGDEYHIEYTCELYYKDANGNYFQMDDEVGDTSTEYVTTWKSMGKNVATTIIKNGKLSLPTKKPLSCNEMDFIGWTTEENYNGDVAPTLVHDGDEISSNMTYYAVFATPNGPGAYTEAASIQFNKATVNNDSSWYYLPEGNAVDGRDIQTEYVASSYNMNVIGGAWVRESTKGLKIGAYKTDNVWGKSTNYDINKNKHGYIVFGLDHSATISKIVISTEKTSSHDDGRIQVDPNGEHTQSPVLFGDNMEYILDEPLNTKTLTIAINHRAAAIKNIKLYTGGTSYIGYTTNTCPSHNIAVAATNCTIEPSQSEANMEDKVNFTITPKAGYVLKSLSVKDADNNEIAVKNNEFFMPASDVTISAVFDTLYTINTQKYAEGLLEADKYQAFAGETVTVTATPAEHYELNYIQLYAQGFGNLDVDANGQFIMPAADVNITASFVPLSYSIHKEETENGSISCPNAADYGQTVTISVNPATNYHLASLSVKDTANNEIAVNENYEFTMPGCDVTISATFSNIYTINIATAANGSITTSPANEAAVRSMIRIIAAPAEGYQLTSVSVIGEDNSIIDVRGNSLFVMPAQNVTITPVFELLPTTEYAITIDPSMENGTVTTDATDGKAVEGSTVALTISPAAGYKLDELVVLDGNSDPVNVDANNNTFIMPASNVTISATFKLASYSIRVTQNIQNGSVSTDTKSATMGQVVTLNVTPNEGYKLGTLTITAPNYGQITYDENFQFVMPASVVIISATFVEDITTAINGINDGKKAIKVIENGVIYIIRGNEKYNIIGTKVQ